MTISSQDINSIVDALQRSDWDEAVVVIGDVRIAVARNGARLGGGDLLAGPAAPASAAPAAVVPAAPAAVVPVAPAPASPPAPAHAAAPTAPAAAGEAGDATVTAPSVGTFWRAPEPSAPPFVQVGDHVDADDTVGIVEIMKLMNNVPAGVSGTVTGINVENGGAVQFGDILVTIRPDAV
ncbi:MAG: acetyl-CoA carboxylase biotin carboxyl carrier protein subunit [Candidatus Leucobacter sulfamidivorax]|nr:acetyl-CoA carboxylase biotin carboxyl carrier protein subunit [Candidatus Leucobacter sulfamidivorax]